MDETIRHARNGAASIAYEVSGDAGSGEPLLLIMGLDFQMVWWPEGFIDQLVNAGFAVVAFDNRDTGLSTHYPPSPRANPFKALMGGVPPVYTQRDMLDDALAVMDAVGWSSAHIVGASMGSALAQGLAMENPERVRSLTCCVGAPADAGVLRTLSYVRPGVFRTLARIKPGRTSEERAEALVEVYRAVSSPAYPFPEDWARRVARISDARSPRDPSTTQRQLAAGRAHRSRDLASITAATLVIAGGDDPLIRWQAGRDVARRISGARFVKYPGMGHTIPPALVPQVVAEIVSLTRACGGSAN